MLLGLIWIGQKKLIIESDFVFCSKFVVVLFRGFVSCGMSRLHAKPSCMSAYAPVVDSVVSCLEIDDESVWEKCFCL